MRRLPEGERDGVRAELDKELAEVSPEQLEKAQKVMADPCSEENFRIDVDFLNQYEPRLRQACNKIASDTQSFGRALWENLPKMMFMFLPLIALVMADPVPGLRALLRRAPALLPALPRVLLPGRDRRAAARPYR